MGIMIWNLVKARHAREPVDGVVHIEEKKPKLNFTTQYKNKNEYAFYLPIPIDFSGFFGREWRLK